MSAPEVWQCRAKPAKLGGQTCGHFNTAAAATFRGLNCCERCGCTKIASDDRQWRAEKGGQK